MEPLRWIRRLRKRLRAAIHTEAVDRELDEEMRFHVEMESQKHIRAGMAPALAHIEAQRSFGAMTQYRMETREARALSWVPDLSLDFKLGFRMLLKYPGMTLVGGLAMAFAIWMGAVTFEMAALMLHPTLPIEGGNRIVLLQNYDASANRSESRVVGDFVNWKQTLLQTAPPIRSK